MVGMRKLLAFIFLSVFLCSFSSAAVNEYNYFKLGELDSANNLVPGITSVSGVGIRSFVCSDAACSGSSGDLWGGSLYTAGSGLNLVYPTSLMSSFGYGFWVYKTGYNPYWVKGVTWAGTGDANPPTVNRYLTRKSNCFSDVSITGPSQVGSTLSFSTGVTSPFVNQYGSMYVPSEVASHLKTLVDVVVEVKNSAGVVVWINSAQRSLNYSSSDSVSFSATLPDGNYVLNAYSRIGNEAKCSSYVQDVDSLSFNVNTCTESVVYTSWSAWSDSEVCQTNDFLTQSRSRSQYDQNSCGNFASVVHWDYQEVACDYCTPSIAYTSWSAWSDIESCQTNDFLTQKRSRVEYDSNSCGEVANVTRWDYQEVACNLFPSVVGVIANPNFGPAPLNVSFSCVAVGGNGNLEYSWDFDNGDVGVDSNVSYVYDGVGGYNVSCKVEDADGDEAFGYVSVDVGLAEFEDVELVCFDEVIVGHNQSCSVSIGVGDVDVDIFYSDGSLFGSCLTDGISGACGVKDLQGIAGSFNVYASASKVGYVDDNSSVFGYDVLDENYSIVDLQVFNDSDFSDEDYDFFRGEDLFVSFVVEDLSGNVVFTNLISEVSLVSSVAGGRVDLEEVGIVNGTYYYRLIPVPITHDFIGGSNVFAFVFDFAAGVGGQEEVSLIIRNNFPVVSPGISNKSVSEGKSFNLDLSDFETDVEDSGIALAWEIVSFGSNVSVSLSGKILTVNGLSLGSSDVVLRLVDLDLDYNEVSFSVDVEEKKSSNEGSSGCRNDWECSIWSECVDDVMVRDCIDRRGCNAEKNRPIELESCSVFDFIKEINSSSVINLGNSFSSVESNFDSHFVWKDYIVWIVWILIVWILILLILILLML